MTVKSSYAQLNSSIRVITLSGDDGTPIIGANVILNAHIDDDKLKQYRAGATNSDGLLEFNSLAPGKYNLIVSFIGHETYTEAIEIDSDERILKRIVLKFEFSELDELVVEGQGNLTTGDVAIRQISPNDLSKMSSPAPGGDLASYITKLPGVVTTGDTGGNLFIRGGKPTQNLVLVDNLQIFKPFHISNLYSAFPGGIIKNADLYAGGFSPEYSGATSGVIDISLRNGSMRHHKASASVSPFMFSGNYEGPLDVDNQSILVQGRYSTIKTFSRQLSGSKQNFDFYDLTVKYALQANNIACNVTAIQTHDSGQIDRFRNLNLEWQNTVAGVRCLGYDENLKFPIDVTFGYMGYSNSENTNTESDTYSSLSSIYFKLKHKEKLFGRPFDYGLTAEFRQFDTRISEQFTNENNFKELRPTVQGYVQQDFDLTENFRAQIGFTTQISLTSNPTFEPRIRTAYNWGQRYQHQLSLASGIYAQTFEGITDIRDAGALFTVIKPSDIGGEIPHSKQIITGYKLKFASLTFMLEAYIKDHSNIPVSKWTPIARIETETAYSNGSTYGIDSSIKISTGNIYSYVGYSYSKVTYNAKRESLGAWIEGDIFSYNPAHDQRHSISLNSSFSLFGFRVNTGWELSSGRPYTGVYGFDLALRLKDQNPNRELGTARTLYSRPYNKRMPIQHKLDISISRLFNLMNNISLNAKAGVINAYDRDNIFYYNLNVLRRVNQTPLMPYLSLEAQIN